MYVEAFTKLEGIAMKNTVILLFISLFSVPLLADEAYSYGIYPITSFYQVDDPAGKTEVSTDFHLMNFYGTYEIGRDKRIWTELGKKEFDYPSSSSAPGMSVKTTDLALQYQVRYRASKNFKPWFGAGLGFADSEYKNRHIVDNNGYLFESFDDRSGKDMSVILTAMSDFEMEHVHLIYGFSYRTSLDAGASGASFNFGVQF